MSLIIILPALDWLPKEKNTWHCDIIDRTSSVYCFIFLSSDGPVLPIKTYQNSWDYDLVITTYVRAS